MNRIELNREIIPNIRNKLQSSLTVLEKLDGGKEVSREWIKKSLIDLKKGIQLLEKLG